MADVARRLSLLQFCSLPPLPPHGTPSCGLTSPSPNLRSTSSSVSAPYCSKKLASLSFFLPIIPPPPLLRLLFQSLIRIICSCMVMTYTSLWRTGINGEKLVVVVGPNVAPSKLIGRSVRDNVLELGANEFRLQVAILNLLLVVDQDMVILNWKAYPRDSGTKNFLKRGIISLWKSIKLVDHTGCSFGDRELDKRSPEEMSNYLGLLDKHKRRRLAFTPSMHTSSVLDDEDIPRQMHPQMQQMVNPQNLVYQQQQLERLRRRQSSTPRPAMDMDKDRPRNMSIARAPPVKVEGFQELMGGDASVRHDSEENKLTSPSRHVVRDYNERQGASMVGRLKYSPSLIAKLPFSHNLSGVSISQNTSRPKLEGDKGNSWHNKENPLFSRLDLALRQDENSTIDDGNSSAHIIRSHPTMDEAAIMQVPNTARKWKHVARE
ncbi:hypothetical protein GH714_042330 [Hevea brasiliensis]|uniref:Uncharacterized protein n=1 Tax=Hevea brasiliensis TaxID=3981 RepID=A0A6A6KBA1_HEVBR|nr:hypothetical protein GH714_042330 [Hevea brasiliensis]